MISLRRASPLVDQAAEVVLDHRHLPLGAGEDVEQVGDRGAQLGGLGLQLALFQAGEPAQLHVEDRLGLALAEAERLHQARLGLLAGLAAADDGDDLVDHVDGAQQAFDDVQAGLVAGEQEAAAADDHVDAVLDPALHQALEPDRARAAAVEGDHVDAEVVLERGVLPQLVEDEVGVLALLQLDEQADAVTNHAAGDVVDALDPLLFRR